MAQRGSRRWIAAAAIVSISWTAVAAHAEPTQTPGGPELSARYHTLFLPILIDPAPGYAGRPAKLSTIFQLDAKIGNDAADVLFRLQFKRKSLVYLYVRF